MFAERRQNTPANGGGDARLALDAQTALLPYALAVFAVALPIYVWACSFAQNAGWMAISFAVFAINWGVFYGVVAWLRGPAAQDLTRRARVHVLSGLCCGPLAVCQMAAFADGAGAARETLLLLSAGAAVVCIFFAAPWLLALLLTAPLAAVGPLYLLFSHPQSERAGGMAFGAPSPWPWPCRWS